ncbi:MAG TPA: cytochrome C [Polaromonas sp.]|uniref:c-type cytochrome n=1 Tax=Polaromonas sp. TaxID=1869339 RepID=UPI002D306057|nr:cytochrome C [Polaromonas sp.]HYW57293.1 cytochrome C [Polaromonas sp.]
MKTALVPLIVVLACSGNALASEKLAAEKQCLQCHAKDRHLIGPSFNAIRDVYKSVKRPEQRLMEVIKGGSSANLGPYWGHVRMPDGSERPAITDGEARQLARWILRG